MSIEVLPVGVTCNLRCDYCYEEAGRRVTPTAKYQREKVLAAARNSSGFWQLFGGEPLLLNLTDLEELLKLSFEQWGQSGMQTNGTLITPKHIDLFRKYNTQVGISLDGPDDLNDSRWAGTVEATRKATAKTLKAIDMVTELAKEPGAYWGHGPTLIVTLHSGNCAPDVLPRFKQWIREIDQKGVRFINFHFLEMDSKASKWYLPDAQLKQAMNELNELSRELVNMKFLNFDEAIQLLRGDSRRAMCVFASCDGWSTSAVQGIGPDGSPGNCTRAVKDGIDWLPGEGFGQDAPWQIGDPFPSTRANIRQLSLYVTPQEHGGCKDCRFFVMCTGHCPGTGEEFQAGYEGDWRLRSTHCEVLKQQFTVMERKLRGLGETPLSQSPELKKIEQLMYTTWASGKQIYLNHAVDAVRRGLTSIPAGSNCGQHGDHTDANRGNTGTGHGDVPHGDHVNTGHLPDNQHHGDAPHGDQHGDHTDTLLRCPRPENPPENSDNRPHGDHTDITPHGDHIDAPLGTPTPTSEY